MKTMALATLFAAALTVEAVVAATSAHPTSTDTR